VHDVALQPATQRQVLLGHEYFTRPTCSNVVGSRSLHRAMQCAVDDRILTVVATSFLLFLLQIVALMQQNCGCMAPWPRKESGRRLRLRLRLGIGPRRISDTRQVNFRGFDTFNSTVCEHSTPGSRSRIGVGSWSVPCGRPWTHLSRVRVVGLTTGRRADG
jgi:hypothetical protein